MLHTPWMIRHKTCVVAKSRHALDQSLTNEGCVSLATARRVDMARGRPNLMMRGLILALYTRTPNMLKRTDFVDLLATRFVRLDQKIVCSSHNQ